MTGIRGLVLLTSIALAIVFVAGAAGTFGAQDDDRILAESTPGRLAAWMADQSGNDPEDILSPLARYADNWATELGEEELDPAILLAAVRNLRSLYFGAILLLLAGAALAVFMRPRHARKLCLAAVALLDILLFLVPSLDGVDRLPLVAAAIVAALLALALTPGKLTRALGFVMALSLFMVGWEAGKGFAERVSYKILLPQATWQYRALPSLDEALAELQAGKVDAVIADRKDLDDLMPPQPPDDKPADELPWPDLRFRKQLNRSVGVAFLPIAPAFPGRLSIALRAEDAASVSSARQVFDMTIATVADEFADSRFLSQPRSLVLLDLKILNDLNLPHLQMIAEAFLQPARRNGELLLLRILADAGMYTFSEAIFGFAFGAALGFLLGALFAHSRLLERGLLPYVVASQTVPILAIAPMVVIWLGAGQLSVAVIAAYLTFFPVTINTLRGMQSPAAEQVELMRSYAATRREIMWKLRLPAALPYIFTALKVSATASVVGAIIGELPSGIGDGLGRAILDFSSDYSLISTPKLWASIVMAAAVGMLFFAAVTACERVALRRYI